MPAAVACSLGEGLARLTVDRLKADDVLAAEGRNRACEVGSGAGALAKFPRHLRPQARVAWLGHQPQGSASLILIVALSTTLTGCGAIAGLVGAPQAVVSIANKITSLPAGQTYTFNVNFQHTQGAGVTVKLTGQGTLLQNGSSAFYIAPPSPPTPNSVTVTATAANGSNVSDSDTFTITAAAGPVVSISPATFSVTGGGAPVTLNISVTQDNPSNVLTGGAGTSPDCNNGPCGVLTVLPDRIPRP